MKIQTINCKCGKEIYVTSNYHRCTNCLSTYKYGNFTGIMKPPDNLFFADDNKLKPKKHREINRPDFYIEKYSQEKINEIQSLYLKNISMAKIGKLVGLSNNTILTIARCFDFKRNEHRTRY